MPKTWKILPRQSDDLIEQVLLNRGLTTDHQRALFLKPELIEFEKELDIPGISKAEKRINQAIKKGELIVVYGDYDVDGICGSAILYKALTALGAKALPYIPHREKDGYGLTKGGLDFARDAGASLVVTVDNGIVAFEQALYAKQLGLDLIITDHHLPLDQKPEAKASVHSTKMCGAAVAWCLVRNAVGPKMAYDLLQFVAIATVCDLVPLVGLGRAFLKEGLKVLNKTDNPGLGALIRESNLWGKEVGSYEVGHVLGPRLNAIGRLEHGIDALRLLCTQDTVKAKRLAKLLCDTNNLRQKLTLDAAEQVKLTIDQTKKIHVLQSKEWVPGIIGLIAGRVCEEYSRPAVVISVGEQISKGSARSSNGINIVEVVRQCKDLLLDVGGHPGAAGFTIANENIASFIERVEKITSDLPEEVEQVLEIEAEVESKKLSKSLYEKISQFEPFGFGNPKPVLATRNMEVTNLRTVGEGKHLKCKLDGIDAIGFGMGSWSKLLQIGQLINAAYVLDLDTYNGYEKLQLKLKDLRLDG